MVDWSKFPHVDPTEASARPGVEGPRYVPWGDRLGDTNTGLAIHPRGEEPAEGYCPQQAEFDESAALAKEGVTADMYLR